MWRFSDVILQIDDAAAVAVGHAAAELEVLLLGEDADTVPRSFPSKRRRRLVAHEHGEAYTRAS